MTTLDGLPAHALLVHAVVVLIPLSAALLVLVALWPAARRRLSLLTAILAALALISVPLTTNAGEWLERHVPRTTLVRTHTQLGDTMLPWAIALFLLAAAVAIRDVLRSRATTSASVPLNSTESADSSITAAPVRTNTEGPAGRITTVGLAVLCVAVAVGSVVTVYRIGESGARAAWDGHFTPQANPTPNQQHDGTG